MTTANDAFWNTVEAELVHSPIFTDARGRLTARGAERKAEHWQFSPHGLKKLGDFETFFNAYLMRAATIKIATARANVEGLPTKKQLNDFMSAYSNVVDKVRSLGPVFAPIRAALLKADFRDVVDELPNPAKVTTALAELDRAVTDWNRRKEWAGNRLIAHANEINAWPAPSLEDLTTLYADGTPQKIPVAAGLSYLDDDRFSRRPGVSFNG